MFGITHQLRTVLVFFFFLLCFDFSYLLDLVNFWLVNLNLEMLSYIEAPKIHTPMVRPAPPRIASSAPPCNMPELRPRVTLPRSRRAPLRAHFADCGCTPPRDARTLPTLCHHRHSGAPLNRAEPQGARRHAAPP